MAASQFVNEVFAAVAMGDDLLKSGRGGSFAQAGEQARGPLG